MPKTINLTINGIAVSVPEGSTILQAAREANVDIPTLCYLKGVNAPGSCRLCLAEVKGMRTLVAACLYPAAEGMEVLTNTTEVREARRINVELILSNHDRECLTCVRNGSCELQKLCDDLGIQDIRFKGEDPTLPLDEKSVAIWRNPNKCILCRRCVSVCKNVQTVSAIDTVNRGFATKIGTTFDKSIADVNCVNCGQCITACPVAALRGANMLTEVQDAINDPDKHVVVQVAPSVRVSIGELFGMPIGTRVTGKLAAALRRCGFDGVFDTDTGADFTIMEEGTELIHRLQNDGKLPQITSCSPGWVKFCEHNYPELLDNLSTAKSPMSMFGALLKSYYAKQKRIDPAKIYVVAIMPCTAKKFEASREELSGAGYSDVDAVLTVRAAARLIKSAGVRFDRMPDEEFDTPFGIGTGAGAIFGATGGVMEAALRTVSEVLENKPLDKIDFDAVRGTSGIKEAEITIAGKPLKVAAVNGLGNARKMLDKVISGEAKYDFIEIMACEGGCVTGGGQPIVDAKTQMDIDVKKVRAGGLYDEDKSLKVRKAHENPIVKKVYEEFLGEPCGHKSHKLLHTHFTKR
ncbi:MAG: NADH-dependent [FeFe] hydrogenase, group A6 [Oscillospiraceae bacterium]|nr:NADH-dependent [FeFe] hydrogenase, group A6 [Oscillospiraceae bacterium]